MTIHLIAVGFLVLAFVITTLRPINLGIICLAGVLLIGAFIGGVPADALYSGFPANLFVILVGVTLLFNIATENGTVDWLIAKLVTAVRGNNAVIPWIMFIITGFFSAIGNAFAVPVMAPIALRYAQRNGISPIFMGLMVIHGCMAGALSPISLYGLIIHGILIDNGIESNPIGMFVIGLAANLLIAVVVYVIALARKLHQQEIEFDVRQSERSMVAVGAGGTGSVGNGAGSPSGRSSASDGRSSGSPASPDGDSLGDAFAKVPDRLRFENFLSLFSIAALVVGSLVFSLDIGLLAIALGLGHSLIKPTRMKPALQKVPWDVVVLVCGVLTYVGVMDELGTIDYVGNSVSSIGAPLIAALLLGYVAAVISAFATSSGVLTALVPLAMPLLAGSDISAFAVIALLGVTSTVVDVSPFSTNGAIVVANVKAENRAAALKRLMLYGGVVVGVVPLIMWAILVAPSGIGG